MSLSDLAALGGFVSGLGVLVSLVFLYFQLRQLNFQARQNARHTQAQIFQGGGARVSNQMLSMADADLVAAAIIGNGGVATPEAIKARQFRLLWHTHYITWDDNHAQHEAGLLSDGVFARLRAIMIEDLRSNPGYVPMYLEFARDYAPDSSFHRFVHDVCSESSAPLAAASRKAAVSRLS
jgi:hypothetical protein